MENIFNYIEKYKDYKFDEKNFNDIDNIVFSCLAYLNYTDVEDKTLYEVAKTYFKNNKFKDVSKLGIAQKESYRILESVYKTNRYKDIILFNYVYEVTDNMQFSAVTFKINDKLNYISFEGTDEFVSGWVEDLQLACFFPILSQEKAISYVKKSVKLLGPNYIIGGHSKGGNLALVSAMYLNKYKKRKVIKIYNNDGPGLRTDEFSSRRYKSIKKKYVHIIPDYSVIGVLLRHDKYMVVKNTKRNILSHAVSNWCINGDRLVLSELSDKSKKIETSLISWLDVHSDEEKMIIVNSISKALKKADVKTLPEAIKIKNFIKIINNIKNIDKDTRKLIIDLIMYNYKNTR